MPGDDRPGGRGDRFCRPAHPEAGQCRGADRLDHPGPDRGPAVPARLRQRPRTRPHRRRPRPTLPWHNGRTEGVNNQIKLLKRQTYGRAGHRLLRQRILLSSDGSVKRAV
ncbi:transposase [Streptomyces sp. T1317-0309]|nr:transposase [Streptomyces sp. T1317-0309]